MKDRSEADLAAVVVAWLRSKGWTVYQEVQSWAYGPRADIVAERDGFFWAIETKKALSFDVVGQASRWRYYLHLGSVAVPKPKKASGRDFALRVCETYGVGVLETSAPDEYHHDYECVSQVVAPALNRRPANLEKFRSRLSEAHKTFAPAGNAEGRFWTPFQETARRLAEIVGAEPGVTLKDAVARIRHHYRTEASARGSLAKWAVDGKLRGIETRKEGGKLRLFPSSA